jgi:hypothetical protein
MIEMMSPGPSRYSGTDAGLSPVKRGLSFVATFAELVPSPIGGRATLNMSMISSAVIGLILMLAGASKSPCCTGSLTSDSSRLP